MALLSVMVGMELASGVIGIGGRLDKKERGIPFILTEAFWDRYWKKGVRPWKTALSLLIFSVGILHTISKMHSSAPIVYLRPRQVFSRLYIG